MAGSSSMRGSFKAFGRLVDGRDRYARAMKVTHGVMKSYRCFKREVFENDDARNAALQKLHEVNAVRVKNLCRKNGATWVKVAQVMSCRPDLLPRAYINELRELQNDAPPVPFEALETVLAEELGADWRSRFRSIDPVPVATASIAQVHRATTIDGVDVAVKVQLPDVARLFKQDFVFFHLVAEVAAGFIKQVDVRQISREMLEMTRQELDFTKEEDNLRKFSAHAHGDRIRFPRLIEGLSTKRVLVTSWVQGQRLREYLDAHFDESRDILTALLDSYIQQITNFGVFHADPHPGNFIIDEEGNITILDFGALGELTPQEALNYGALLMALFRRSSEGLEDVFTRAGFSGLDEATFRDLAKTFLGTRRGEVDFADQLSAAMDTLQQHRVIIPDSFVALARVLVTVGGFMQTYKVKMNLDAALMTHVAKAAMNSVATLQQAAAAKA